MNVGLETQRSCAACGTDQSVERGQSSVSAERSSNQKHEHREKGLVAHR
jgi:hypothetical protein